MTATLSVAVPKKTKTIHQWPINTPHAHDTRRELGGDISHYVVEGRDEWMKPTYRADNPRDPYFCFGRARADAKRWATIENPMTVLAYNKNGTIRTVETFDKEAKTK